MPPPPRRRSKRPAPPGASKLDSEVGATTYIPRTASRPRRLIEGIVRAQRAYRISAAAGKEIFGCRWRCKWMLILLRLRCDSQRELRILRIFVHMLHTCTYLVQPKTRADLGIKL
jgi:hypothetical protein